MMIIFIYDEGWALIFALMFFGYHSLSCCEDSFEILVVGAGFVALGMLLQNEESSKEDGTKS